MIEKTPNTQPTNQSTPEESSSKHLTGEERMRLNNQANQAAILAGRALEIANGTPKFTAQGDMILPHEADDFREAVVSK